MVRNNLFLNSDKKADSLDKINNDSHIRTPKTTKTTRKSFNLKASVCLFYSPSISITMMAFRIALQLARREKPGNLYIIAVTRNTALTKAATQDV